MRMDRLKDATVSDVMENPGYYGMPNPQNIAEIRAFMNRMRPRKDQEFASVDQGSRLLSAYVRTQKYFIESNGVRYACGKSLDKVAVTAERMGLRFEELEAVPQIIPDAGLKCDLEITFRVKRKKTNLVLPEGY